jgi:SAM-dependent methyltransferase
MFDTDFGMGSYKDVDICVRINLAGYRTVLCHNSFIYHYGNLSFSKRPDLAGLLGRNAEKFKEKWHFDPTYSNKRKELISLITRDNDDTFRVLEVGCGTCETLSGIQHLFPNAVVKGIELDETRVKIMSHAFDVIQGNIENMALPYDKKYFDYIIFGDVLEHLYEPEKTLVHLREYLSDSGILICSLPNIMHGTVMIELMKGEFTYQDSGILDRTHLHFFTLKSAARMLIRAGYKVNYITSTGGNETSFEENKEIIDGLSRLLGDDAPLMYAYQLIFKAEKQL